MENIAAVVEDIFINRIPYNKSLGIRYQTLEDGQPAIRLDMRDELVGNFTRKTLHGGVIASILDAMGGFIVALDMIQKNPDTAEVEKFGFPQLGTIDLRIDYLRPGRGEYFIATASVLRTGNKVAVTRMELHCDQHTLIAVGTGTYLVG